MVGGYFSLPFPLPFFSGRGNCTSFDLMNALTSLRASSNCFFSTLSVPLKLPIVRLAQVAQPNEARYESRSHVRQPPMLIIIIEKASESTCVSGSLFTFDTNC